MPPAPAAPALSGGAKAAGYKPGRYSDADPTFGAPTKADMKAMKSQARTRDAAERERYEADEPTKTGRSDGRGGSQSKGPGTKGPANRSSKTMRPANIVRGRPTVAGGGPVEEGAGLLLGLVAYALLMSYVRYGPAGVRGWFAAKFLNRPYAPAVGDAPASPIPPAPQSSQAKPSSAAYPSPRAVLV